MGISRFPGELKHFEGTDALCNSKQDNREIFYTTDSGTLRYKTSGGNLVHFAIYSPNMKFTETGGLAVRLYNYTGSTSVVGQIIEASGYLGFRTADANDVMPIGIVYEAVSNAQLCWVVVAGIANVLIDAGGCTIGDWIGTGATAGSADGDATTPAATQHFQECGHALETRVGAGLARAIIHFN